MKNWYIVHNILPWILLCDGYLVASIYHSLKKTKSLPATDHETNKKLELPWNFPRSTTFKKASHSSKQMETSWEHFPLQWLLVKHSYDLDHENVQIKEEDVEEFSITHFFICETAENHSVWPENPVKVMTISSVKDYQCGQKTQWRSWQFAQLRITRGPILIHIRHTSSQNEWRKHTFNRFHSYINETS
jgi:hypothetical protein